MGENQIQPSVDDAMLIRLDLILSYFAQGKEYIMTSFKSDAKHFFIKNKEAFLALLLLGVFVLVFLFFQNGMKEPTEEEPLVGNDTYQDMRSLLEKEPAGNYEIILEDRKSPVLVVAPHGGKIEPRTGNIAKAIAGEEFNYFEFAGKMETGNYQRLHVKSVSYNPPTLDPLLKNSGYSLSVHGVTGEVPLTYVGGLDEENVQKVVAALKAAGFTAMPSPDQYNGSNKSNFINKNLRQKGIQLEISTAQRYALFDTKTDRKPNEQFNKYTQALRSVLLPLAKNPSGY